LVTIDIWENGGIDEAKYSETLPAPKKIESPKDIGSVFEVYG